jgi:PadR family transcriptional regulator PadR
LEISALEQQVLLALLRLNPNGYGVSVRDELLDKTGNEHSLGSVYAALDRLARKGFVASRQGEATAERGGRSKLYFTITGEGRRSLDRAVKAIDILRQGLSGVGALR